jgi:hypothetical protein
MASDIRPGFERPKVMDPALVPEVLPAYLKLVSGRWEDSIVGPADGFWLLSSGRVEVDTSLTDHSVGVRYFYRGGRFQVTIPS